MKSQLKLLLERYGDRQKEIDAHYVALMELPQVKNSTAKLRALYDTINTHLRSLEALSQDTSQDIFKSLIFSKIPADIHEQLENKKDRHDAWTVPSLLASLESLLHAKEQAEHTRTAQKSQSVPTISEAFVAVAKPPNHTPKCHFCGQAHWSDECPSYTTVEARKDKVKGVCFVCLKLGHMMKNCKVKRPCFHCKKSGRHHRSLCPEKFAAHSAGMLAARLETVVMQTACAAVENMDKSCRMRTSARLFLDSGSHRSYIHESMARKLELQEGQPEHISLVTFGNTTPKSVFSRTVSFGIETIAGDTIKVTANTVPNITGPIQKVPFDTSKCNNWQGRFGQFRLADSIAQTYEACHIDILIGNDYYLDIILPCRYEVQPGLHLLDSKLGWILSGHIPLDGQNPQELAMSVLTFTTPAVHQTNAYPSADSNMASISDCVKDFWALESIGIRDSLQDDDSRAALV